MCEKCKDKPLTIDSIITWCKGDSALGETSRRKRVHALWNDSRKLESGDIFVAVKSDRDDGHRYVLNAFKAGAAAAIVSRAADVDLPERYRKKLIVVRDTVKALQHVAYRYRQELGILIIGITGSNGKTTTRSCMASVLRRRYPVGETYGNWNNHIGVPLSLLRFTGDEWAGVIEMGANHQHEIHELSMIARPDIALITNIGYGHVGLFGSLANIESAKFEIADGLNKRQGFMLLNGDDKRLMAGAKRRGLKAFSYGLSEQCDIFAQNVRIDPKKGLSFMVDGFEFCMPVLGRHFLYSALPSIFMGRRCGIPDAEIAEVLASQQPVSMRGTVEEKHGARFILDCYNANPSSMKHGIALLCDIASSSKRVAIVGDMLELGKFSSRLHRELGKQLGDAGVNRIVAVGEFAKHVADGAKEAGVSSRKIWVAQTAEEATGIAREVTKSGDTVLLKGSRGMHLETVYQGF